ncbi:unnamed protein product [Withania somnifera]
MFLTVFGLKWVMSESIKDDLVSWSSWKVGKSTRKVWKMIPACIFWCIWTERNFRCFEGTITPSHKLKARCLTSLYSWSNLSPVTSPNIFLDFISSLTLD